MKWASSYFILLLSALVTLRNSAFLSADNFRDILLNISILVIVALAQMMVIITRGIDLSVGSTIGLTAMMTSFTVVALPGMPVVLALPLSMALGAMLGALNGLIIAYGHVPPIIATLGTLSVYRGLIFLYSNGQWVTADKMPPDFKQLAKGTPLGVPNLIVFAIVAAVGVFLFLKYTRTGRDIYAVGATPMLRASRAYRPSASFSSYSQYPACCAAWPGCCGPRASRLRRRTRLSASSFRLSRLP